MCTLLIAEDEYYTRRGILHKIPLQQIGISRVIEADDGVNALRKVKDDRPDIALLDVRMPRMNGIALAENIRKLYPECVIVFISGYSDKEYLRSAIKLKAIQYVDKPINHEELIVALQEAVRIFREEKKKQELVYAERRTRLAQFLTRKNPEEILKEQIQSCGMSENDFQNGITFLLQPLYEQDMEFELQNIVRESVGEQAKRLLQDKGYGVLYCGSDPRMLLFHLFSGSSENAGFFKAAELKELLCGLSQSLRACPHFIAAGMPVSGAENLFRSYRASVVSLQENFYEGMNSVTFFHEEEKPCYVPRSEIMNDFEEALAHAEQEKADALLKELSAAFYTHRGTVTDSVRETYYQLILRLVSIAQHRQIDLFQTLGVRPYLWETVSSVHTLEELTAFVSDLMRTYFDALHAKSKGSGIASRVEDYIEKNFTDPDLSIGAISETFKLTPAYLCLVFKEEKKQTINQFITDCRMKNAGRDLENPRLKISEIALRSGYRDNSYFTKLFKRHFGKTPTEYREGLMN